MATHIGGYFHKHRKGILEFLNITASLITILGLFLTFQQIKETKELAYLDLNTKYYVKKGNGKYQNNEKGSLSDLKFRPQVNSGKVKATYMAKVSGNNVKIKDISNKSEMSLNFFQHKNGLKNGQDYIGGYIVYINASDNQEYFDYLYWVPLMDSEASVEIDEAKRFSNHVNIYERSGSRSITDGKMLDESLVTSKIKQTERNMNLKSSDSPVNSHKILSDRKKIHDYLKEYFE